LLIEIPLLEALAFDAQGQRDRALVALEQSLALAEPEGYTRAFLSVGTPVVPLLRAMVARGLHPAYAARLLTFLSPTAQDAGVLTAPPSSTVSLLEPLSEREREVLRLLGSALSTEEIAQTLYLSVHTVRSHLKACTASWTSTPLRGSGARARPPFVVSLPVSPTLSPILGMTPRLLLRYTQIIVGATSLSRAADTWKGFTQTSAQRFVNGFNEFLILSFRNLLF
jgi:hypothetical protein